MSSVDLTRIAENISTLNALNSLQYINMNLAVYQNCLSSGIPLNETCEDHSRLNFARVFDVRCHSLKSDVYTIKDVKNLMSNVEGGIKKVQNLLVKIYNVAIEANSDTLDADQRAAIDDMIQDFVAEIDIVITNTQWNGMNLLGGTDPVSSIGFMSDPEGISTWERFSLTSVDPSSLGIDNLDVSGDSRSLPNINAALSAIHNAINKTKTAISDVGEFRTRLIFMEEVLSLTHTKTESEFNRIKNAEMAEKQTKASRSLILQQTTTAMLAQANMTPQFLLSLFN